MSTLHTQGPVPLSSQAYVERPFEAKVYTHLIAGNWVLLLGPRQHGKTTALHRLKQRFLADGLPFAIVDLQACPPCTAYNDFLAWVASRLARQFETTTRLGSPLRYPGEVTSWLELVLPEGSGPVFAAFDEAASILNDEWRNIFYAQLRSITTDRADAAPGMIAKRVGFVFSGTFRPESIVYEYNSPFNVCERVEPEDLSREDLARLWQSATTEPVGQEFCDQVYDLARGQPYLSQLLLREVLESDAADRESRLQDAVQRLRSGSDLHFEGVFSKVTADQRLLDIVRRIVLDGSVPVQPADADYRYLQVLGIARRDGDRLLIRNPIYREFAKASSQVFPNTAVTTTADIVGLPVGSLSFMKDDRLREIAESLHRGATRAHNMGSYRFSLIGFGVALEALLLDVLLSAVPSNLSSALAKAGGPTILDARYENPVDATTWRLVTVMRVARAGIVPGQWLDPPDALRELRNLVHPAEMLKAYHAEPALAPESNIAAGLFHAFYRDVQAALP